MIARLNGRPGRNHNNVSISAVTVVTDTDTCIGTIGKGGRMTGIQHFSQSFFSVPVDHDNIIDNIHAQNRIQHSRANLSGTDNHKFSIRYTHRHTSL